VVDFISSLGAGSGIDIKSLAKSLTDATKAPEQAQLDTKRIAAESRVSSVAKIMATVTDFSDALNAIGDPSTFQRLPESSDTSKVSVEFIDGTIPPTFNSQVKVNNLAVEASAIFPPVSDLGASLIGGDASRTLTLYKGVDATGDILNSFDLTEYNTLPELRDAINLVEGFSATILQGGTPQNPSYYLSVKHGTGAENSFYPSITSSDGSLTPDGTNDGLMTSTATIVAGEDAEIEIDGITVQSSTNDFKNILPGLQITAAGETGANTVSISSQTNAESLTIAISTLVVGYNELIKVIKSETQYNEDPTKRGSLSNNSSATQLINQLRRFTTQPISGYDSGSYTLTELGVTTNLDGTISFDEKAFATIIKNNPNKVEAVLASKRQIFDSRLKFGSAGQSLTPGVYKISKSGTDTWSVNEKQAAISNGLLTYNDGTNANLSLMVSSELQSNTITNFSTNLYYAKGLVERFNDMLKNVSDPKSSIQTISSSAKSEISEISKNQTKLDARMQNLNDRYLKQFAAMQTFITQANDTKKSLTSMMDAWSNSMNN
jgi:flagellar hook-associated protein 2